MKRINLFFLSLLATLLVTTNAWGQTDPLKASTTMPSAGTPEVQYYIHMSYGDNISTYWQANTVPGTSSTRGRFAFYKVDGVEGAYHIYSLGDKSWISYTPGSAEYAEGTKSFAKRYTLAQRNGYWKIEKVNNKGSQPCYQFRPFYTSGSTGGVWSSRYLNYYQGVGSYGGNTIGIWKQGASQDNGSGWTLEIADPTTYTVSCSTADGGVVYNNTNYTNEQQFNSFSGLSISDIKPIALEGMAAKVSISGTTITVTYQSIYNSLVHIKIARSEVADNDWNSQNWYYTYKTEPYSSGDTHNGIKLTAHGSNTAAATGMTVDEMWILKKDDSNNVTLHALSNQKPMAYNNSDKGNSRVYIDATSGNTYNVIRKNEYANYPYVLQTTTNTSYYVSNHGGYAQKDNMGIYNATQDQGTAINFEAVQENYTFITLKVVDGNGATMANQAITMNSAEKFVNNGKNVYDGEWIAYKGNDAASLTAADFTTLGFDMTSVVYSQEQNSLTITCEENAEFELITIPAFVGSITIPGETPTVLTNGQTHTFLGTPEEGTEFTVNTAFGYNYTTGTAVVADHKITVTYTFNGTIATDDKSGVIFINSNVRNSTNAASENYDNDNSDGNHKVYGKANDHNDPTQLWLAEKAADGKYTLRNLNTGRYLHGNGNNTDWYTTTETSYLYLNAVSSTSYYSFGMSNSADNYDNMNLRGNLSAICGYKATGDQGSQWKVDVVGDKSQYTIYNVRVEGYLGEAANAPTVSPKFGVTPVGNRALTNGEAFFFLNENDPALTAENVNEKFTVNVPSGYECSLSYISATQTIKVTATPTIVINSSTGAFSGSGTYHSEWASNSTPQVKINVGSDRNNMNYNGSAVQIFYNPDVPAGNTYTVSISSEYIITGFYLKFKNAESSSEVSITYNGTAKTPSGTGYETFDISGLETSSFALTTGGASKKFAVLEEFYIYYDKSPNKILWTSSTARPHYRIPAIACTAGGKLIAVADERMGGDIGDNTKISLAYKTSTDNGETWSTQGYIVEGDIEGHTKAYSDPAIVADREDANKIVAFSTNGDGSIGYGTSDWSEGGSTYLATSRYESSDGGATWTVTHLNDTIYQIFKNSATPVKGLFFSSGRILQSRYVKVGSAYRIYAALAAKPNGNRVIYSDDFGKNWHALGGIDVFPCPNGDEVKVEELPDGRILLSSRKASGRYFNVYTYTNTETGEGYWQAQTNAPLSNVGGLSASSNACNGEILIVPAVKQEGSVNCYLALQSVPTGSDRVNVSIFYKELSNVDDLKDVSTLAANWDGSYQVSSTTSGYSTMVLQKDNNIGFFFEENAQDGGYQMTYRSLTIEKITNNAYTLGSEDNRKTVVQSYLPAIVDTWTEGDYVGEISAATKTTVKNNINAWASAPTSTQLDAVFGATNKLQEGGFYRFVSAYPNYEEKQSVKKAIFDASNHTLKWKDVKASTAGNSYLEQIFYLAKMDNGTNYLYNVFTGFYPQVMTNGSTAIPTTIKPIAFEFISLGSGQYNIKSIGSNNPFHTEGHSSGSGTDGNIVTYQGGLNSASAWYIECISSSDAITTAMATRVTESKTSLQTAITAANNLSVGPEIGKIATDKTTERAAATQKAQDVHDADSYVKIDGDLAQVTMQHELIPCYAKPAADRFYTLKCISSSRYLLSVPASDNDALPCSLEADLPTGYQQVFKFVDGNKLQGYNNGYYAANSQSGQYAKMTAKSGSENATSIAFEAQDANKFIIVFNGNRHLYGKDATSDAGGTTGTGTGYEWELEDVTANIYDVTITPNELAGTSVKITGSTDREATNALPWIYSTSEPTDLTCAAVTGYKAQTEVSTANRTIDVEYYQLLSEGLYWLTSDDTNYLTYDGSSYTTVASADRVAGSIFYINGNTVKAQGQTVSEAFEYKADGKLYKGDVAYVVQEATALKIDVNGLNGSTRKYATFCAPFPVSIPVAFDAYKATVNTETGVITLTHITGLEASEKVIDAGTPVLIHSKEFSSSSFGAAPYTKGGITYLDDPSNNDTSTDFKGSFVKTSFAELTGNNYVLGASNGVIGFYKMKENANLRANSAYVQIPSTTSQDGDAKGFSISFEDDPTTIYELVDGQLVEKDAPIYNLGGQKISKLQKGINIVNGKKVYIK